MIQVTINWRRKTAHITKNNFFVRDMMFPIVKNWVFRKLDCDGGNLDTGERHYNLIKHKSMR